uniref:Ubiquitin-conjugating enzyme n=1 Tax=Coccidioides posadasii RMSCC 3488 TaxID=454284 RepID=A0A0J6FUL5_COCPO|nr:ubiquitin-conjugating enzyme [Coccidioides posadasii RMSCC 3488]
MPRRDFIRDLQKETSSADYPSLLNVGPGEDDGTISCSFKLDGNHEKLVDIHFLISDLSDYPRDHSYFLYTTSDDVPYFITACLEKVQAHLRGLRVADMLLHLSGALNRVGTLRSGKEFSFSGDSDEDTELENDCEMEDAEVEDFEGDWSPNSPFLSVPNADTFDEADVKGAALPALMQNLASDLRTSKVAGFRVGYLGNVVNPIICISCRISRLGISEEAMEAWKVTGQQYLVCLIRYIGRYRTLEEILQEDVALGKPSIELLVDLCDSYKPTMQSVLAALGRHHSTFDTMSLGDSGTDRSNAEPRAIVRSFISKPINSLMNERFVKILRYRLAYGLSWEGAELFFNEIQGKPLDYANPGDREYSTKEREASTATSLPPLTNDAFEALKPYVCSKSLCLYQYMALGFGPSLEWEILAQPNVVDLLISFTYSSARNMRLSDFPVGLGFLVPSELINAAQGSSNSLGSFAPILSSTVTIPAHKQLHAELDRVNMELRFRDKHGTRCLRAGDWIVITECGGDKTPSHCRVKDTSLWPSVKLGPPISVSHGPSKCQMNPPIPGYQKASFVLYDKNFDELTNPNRQATICLLLDTLPPVKEMKAYLAGFPSASQPSLSNWTDRISKSALDLLRWIVASNRSCIIQDYPDTVFTDQPETEARDHGQNLVQEMNGYLQFRFAQGAPDKEQRFIQSVATSSDFPQYPTIFAWHGSPLYNWHGILREGLHYKSILHGRAYGNGVYMSPSFGVASSYIRASIGNGWPQSNLEITSAISLNEVVNAPGKFVSNNPHLVVSELDWIQTRYLFVSCKNSSETGDVSKFQRGGLYYQQDPKYKAMGPQNKEILIPMTAFSRQRRLTLKAHTFGSTPSAVQAKLPALQAVPNGLSEAAGMEVDGSKFSTDQDSWISDDTDTEDILILINADEKGKSAVRHPPIVPEVPKTDFVPGKLDGSTLALLGPPSFATPGATKALQRDLRTTLQIQENTPLHELGWYIDPNLINTVYQWIVELHSFEPKIPLSDDLRVAGLTSIVIELRFSKDYPISPPFVRVIRPRFLGFQQGGGGHVTAGGALCMELLTNSGWSAVSSIESVLLQVRLALSSMDPRPARLQRGQNVKKGTVNEYGMAEAIDAYVRACRMHGWEVPQDFAQHMGGLAWSSNES